MDITAPLQGTVVVLLADDGAAVSAGSTVALVESMKMHHDVVAPTGGVVSWSVAVGDTVVADASIGSIDAIAGESSDTPEISDVVVTGDFERPDLDEVVERHRVGLDEARPDAVTKRHDRGRRTARENIADLVDDGTLREYGPLVVAAQRRRRELDDLIASTPADGLVGGLAQVNGELVGTERAACVVASYDYTVLAGTQGSQNHRKKDRLFEIARQLEAPVVIFTEGGGGRPGDTDGLGVSGLDCVAFLWFAELSGTVPLVGVASGYNFAGNAALLGCCDVVIATEGANIGMGGPAMIEGGGLGTFAPTEIGPLEVQRANGVVDLVAADGHDLDRPFQRERSS